MLAAALAAGTLAQGPPPRVITRSSRLKPGIHLVSNPSEDGSSAALVIRGNNITVDFGGMTLRGTPATAEPNARVGTGVLVQGQNVTIKNLKVHGYKIGLMARNAKGLRILDSDFSYNWKQRLLSTLEKEDLADWMSFHQNEKDEWLRFGAGIYLSGCDGAVVRGVKIAGGQSGLMMTRTNRAKVIGNTFQFLSAVGLGMYRSSDNLIQQNKIDWAVRGYSHGVYNRGQDSTGILIYEQSHRNTFAYNSVTHGGDGFFLWAGQTTMDTGQGGCNDNLLVGNDFSHAPTNGIEATFSRNAYVNNLVLECWHGGWLGYSYESLVWRNVFGLNADGIAWEHGQDNLILENTFHRDNMGIRLWQNLREDPNWGYPKNRDTSSRNNRILRNQFSDIPEMVLNLRNTKSVSFHDNRVIRVGRLLVADERAEPVSFRGGVIRMTPSAWEGEPKKEGLSPELSLAHAPSPRTMQPSGNVIQGVDPATKDYLQRFNVAWNPKSSPSLQGGLKVRSPRSPKIPAWLPGVMNPFIPKGSIRGRRFILVDEWGPYDFQSPRLWPRKSEKKGDREVWTFDVLGPAGRWSLKQLTPGAKASAQSGVVPAQITVDFPANAQDLKASLEYVGARTVDYRGVSRPAGAKVPFGYSKVRLPISWQVRHFNYEAATEDPRTSLEAWRAKLAAAESTTPQEVSELNGAWSGSPAPGINANNFGTLALGDVTVAPGDYTINVTTDDGFRLLLDGKVVLESWKYQGPTLYSTTLKLGGRHRLRVEHFELDGYSALRVDIVPKK